MASPGDSALRRIVVSVPAKVDGIDQSVGCSPAPPAP